VRVAGILMAVMEPRPETRRIRTLPLGSFGVNRISSIQNIDRIVGRVGHVDPAGGLVNRGMVEPPGLRMCGRLDEAQMPERHVSVPLRVPRLGARRAPQCDRARPRSRH
jgi:hypothetical protein